MNLDKMVSLVEGIATKADKIRVLDREGYSRSEIANFLGIRYQHVRNTLEADKRTGYSPEINYNSIEDVQSASSTYFRAVDINVDGFAQIPPDMLEKFGEGEAALFAVAAPDGIFLSTLAGMANRVAASIR